MTWQDVLKAEQEAETALAEAMKLTQEAVQEFQRWKDSETQSADHPNFLGQHKRIKPDFLINKLNQSLQHLQKIQTELRKPASGGNPDFDKTTPQQNLVDINTGKPIPFNQKQLRVGDEWRDVE